jgi:uncharacterized protein
MGKFPVIVLLLAYLCAMAGCQSPIGPSPSAHGAATPQPSSDSSFNPLAKLEKSLVFVPVVYPLGNWRPHGLEFEDAWFAAPDGTRLHGWYVPHENPKAVVLYCHGNAGNLTVWADALRILHDQIGVSVMIFDYRGYGRSEGSPSESGVLADARAARAWLAERTRIPEGQVVLMGRSLGGAVAVDLAAKDGARALILESTFTSMPEVGRAVMPWLPVKSIMRTKFNSLAKMPNYRGPLLQSHGTADSLIPYAMGRKLFDAANEPKQFVVIPGGDHNDPQTEDYYRTLSEFLSKI